SIGATAKAPFRLPGNPNSPEAGMNPQRRSMSATATPARTSSWPSRSPPFKHTAEANLRHALVRERGRRRDIAVHRAATRRSPPPSLQFLAAYSVLVVAFYLFGHR